VPIRSTEIGVAEVEEAITHLRHSALPAGEKHERIDALLLVREHMLGRCSCCDA
jgi:hypothetical protein